jgi:dihydroflavonol-4-reductase
MEYFVTGATGFIGTRLVERLVADGHDVIALTRSFGNADHLPDAARIVEGDILEPETLREPMTGVDGVFHMAAWYEVGPGPWAAERAERINVEGTRNVLELVGELDVPKAVYTSSVVVNGDTDGAVVDESYRHDGPFGSVYEETKWRAHYEVVEPMLADGLPVVVVMPGVVYGPGADGPLRNGLFVPYLRGELPMIPRTTGYAFEHVDDTVDSHVRAMAHGEPGEEYVVCGHNTTVTDLLALCEGITGISPPRSIPAAPLGVLSRLVALVEPTVKPPEDFRSESLRALAVTYYGDNAKARRDLGIEHRPLEAGLREYLQWERDQQGL